MSDAKNSTLPRPRVLLNTGNNEWYTPSYIVEAARRTMGGIDLDPASSDEANDKHVGAKDYYTKETDGLSQQWHGRVWMNPPYSNGLIMPFIVRLRNERRAGNVTQATVLVNNGTETRWCHELFSLSDAACFLRGRVKFYRPDGTTGPPLQGQVVFYSGDNVADFAHQFASLGAVLVRDDQVGAAA